MSKFKVGDRVKVLRSDGTPDELPGGYRVGQIVYVLEVYKSPYLTVDSIRTGPTLKGPANNGWTANYFELYKRKKLRLKLP